MDILITGVDGFLGGKITKKLVDETDFNVVGITQNMAYVRTMLDRENITQINRLKFLSNEEFLNSEQKSLNIFGAIHLAFARRTRPAEDIASSVKFAADVFHRLAEYKIDHVINMSSQGIYGNTEQIRTEKTVPAPATQYTMAKYASEIIFNDIMKCPHHTNFRLDPVAQSQNVLKGICKSAKEGKIFLKGGKQVFSFLDVSEVPGAVSAMLNVSEDWDSVYNVGWNRRRFNLIELANVVADVAEKCGYKRPEIELEKDDTVTLWAGMDSTRFMDKTGWKPVKSLEETVTQMLKS